MKIAKDGNGKCIVDFEGLEIAIEADCSCNELFNPDTVSEIRNGVWVFGKNSSLTVSAPTY